MRMGIMQPYLFPYVGYFQLINAVDKFVLLDDVHFIKKGWINRNSILVNQKKFLFTIPLQKASQNKLINELKIISEDNWKRNLLKTITTAYRNAKCFNTVIPLLQKIILSEKEYIADMAYYSLIEITNYLSINTEIVKSSTIYANRDLKAQARLIDICSKETCCCYINAIGGEKLYDRFAFAQSDIQLLFLEPRLKYYKQFKTQFIPGLSIIDLLMHNTVDELKDMLSGYVLKESVL